MTLRSSASNQPARLRPGTNQEGIDMSVMSTIDYYIKAGVFTPEDARSEARHMDAQGFTRTATRKRIARMRQVLRLHGVKVERDPRSCK